MRRGVVQGPDELGLEGLAGVTTHDRISSHGNTSIIGSFLLGQSPRSCGLQHLALPQWLVRSAFGVTKSGVSKPSVKRRNTDASSLRPTRAALSMPSLATLVYIGTLPVAALQQSKNEGGADRNSLVAFDGSSPACHTPR